ncbi:MAG: DUF3341 domain-containing protein [Planctomycetota bacterium]
MSTRFVIGLYREEHDLLEATRAARSKGCVVHDAYTPYPVHGLDEAMGLKPTRLGVVCFVLGMAGVVIALGFQSWTFTSDWPMNVGGKSALALPALGPVTFELGVLFAALGTVLALFIRAGLHPGRSPRVAIPEVSNDRFALALVADAGGRAREVLKQHHAVEIRELEVTP